MVFVALPLTGAGPSNGADGAGMVLASVYPEGAQLL
jgi:hypothetical protein